MCQIVQREGTRRYDAFYWSYSRKTMEGPFDPRTSARANAVWEALATHCVDVAAGLSAPPPLGPPSRPSPRGPASLCCHPPVPPPPPRAWPAAIWPGRGGEVTSAPGPQSAPLRPGSAAGGRAAAVWRARGRRLVGAAVSCVRGITRWICAHVARPQLRPIVGGLRTGTGGVASRHNGWNVRTVSRV